MQVLLEWVDTWMPQFIESKLSWPEFKQHLLDIQQPEDQDKCVYVFKKGKNMGKVCGVTRCSKHKSTPSVDELKLDLRNVVEESDREALSSSDDSASVIDFENVEDTEEKVDDNDDDE